MLGHWKWYGGNICLKMVLKKRSFAVCGHFRMKMVVSVTGRKVFQSNWMYNPSVELAACLIAWSPNGSAEAELGWVSLEQGIHYAVQVAAMDQHEVRNFRNCLTILRPYEDIFNFKMNDSLNQVEKKIRQLTADCIDQDVPNWGSGYKALPLDLIKYPSDVLYQTFKTFVEQNLKFYVDQMSEEGIWDISWSWDQYPDEFSIARRYWQGILAV